MQSVLTVLLGVVSVLTGATAVGLLVAYLLQRRALSEARRRNGELELELFELAKFRDVRDATAEAAAVRAQAQASAEATRAAADGEAAAMRMTAQAHAEALRRDAESTVVQARDRASEIIQTAEHRAREVAGDALRAKENAAHYEQTATAMRNIVEGYGDRYVLPTYSLLDELADAFGFAEAGEQLKRARETTRRLIGEGKAATCEYAEPTRRGTAIRFVTDAFNGKVDSILTQVKTTNYGTLAQQIRDQFNIVNQNGAAFRSARILPDYLAARLSELEWAVRTIELRDREREEQRLAKERLREEERARREYDRALKDAQKEEDTLRKAIDRAQDQAARANDEQRAKYESQLADLTARLHTAEEKSQRAISLAQLTRSGNVYVISNIGSFGNDVLKIGMTRRLEPFDRIRELGDASVPFSFDVHVMIWSEDAPALERELHRRFVSTQLNKVNPRKEFFQVSVADVRAVVQSMNLDATWTLAAEAAEYRESLAIGRSLSTDPAARAAWLRRQLAWDPAEDLTVESLDA